MQLITSLALVDWLAIVSATLLVALIMITDAGSLARYRRGMAYGMLMLASTMAYILYTTDAGGSVFFGTWTEESGASARRKKSQQAMHASDKNQAGEDPSGPGDGDGGAGEEMQLALAGAEMPGAGGGLGAGVPPKGKRGGGADKDGGMMVGAEAGGGGEADEIDEAATEGDDKIRTRRDCERCPALALVKPGTLDLGGEPSEPGFRPHEGPLANVTFDKPYWIGRTEVTRAEFTEFLKKTGHRMQKGCVVQHKMRFDYGVNLTGLTQSDDHPVICVSWLDAKAYVRWLAKVTGKPYRLPSEAEWEYAARAGARHVYPWGNVIAPEDANFALFVQNTMPVGRYRQNAFGLFDMAGNVWEWVEDCWSPDRRSATPDGKPYVASGCHQRVLKGGAWYNTARYVRPAARWANPTAGPGNGVGFRVARGVVERVVAAGPASPATPGPASPVAERPAATVAAPAPVSPIVSPPAPRAAPAPAPAQVRPPAAKSHPKTTTPANGKSRAEAPPPRVVR